MLNDEYTFAAIDTLSNIGNKRLQNQQAFWRNSNDFGFDLEQFV